MKILFLSNIPTPNQLDFFKKINLKKNIHFKYVCLDEIESDRYWKLDASYVDILNFQNKFSDYLNFWKLLKEYSPDVIVIGGYSLKLSNTAIMYAKLHSNQVLYWMERPNFSEGLKTILKNIYLSIRLKSVDKIIAIGKMAQEYYEQFHSHVYNLPYSMNLEMFYQIKRSKNIEAVRFLYTGQFIDRKNVIALVKAFKTIANEDVSLDLVGAGEQKEELESLIKNDNRIRILPFVQPHELYHTYASADVYIMPSKHDGWALVINEAMASAMPIISTNKVGAVVEYIEDGKNGIVSNIDEITLKNAMQYYIDNRKNIYKHGQINREKIKSSNADVNNAVHEMIKIINEN